LAIARLVAALRAFFTTLSLMRAELAGAQVTLALPKFFSYTYFD
jgi:hypothetical protein